MRLAHVGAILAVTLVLAACGGPSAVQQRRAAVNAYFERVDRAEAGLLASVGQIDRTFHQYSLIRVTPSELSQLAFAQTTIGGALRALRGITPPPDARHIHADILRFTTLQYHVAHELDWTAHYLPRSARALAPLLAAGRTLSRDISTAASPASKSSPRLASSRGAGVWAQARCASCHTLAAASARGSSGPDLDLLHPSAAQVAAHVRAGGPGMPSFAGALSATQIAAVASFVSASETVPPTTAAALTAFGAAFRRYGASLRRVLAALRPLDAPPVLRPSWLAEQRILSRSVSLCATITADLAKRDIPAANAAIRQLFLTVASGTNATKDHQKAAAAVRVYDHEIVTAGMLAARIARERSALARELG